MILQSCAPKGAVSSGSKWNWSARFGLRQYAQCVMTGCQELLNWQSLYFVKAYLFYQHGICSFCGTSSQRSEIGAHTAEATSETPAEVNSESEKSNLTRQKVQTPTCLFFPQAQLVCLLRPWCLLKAAILSATSTQTTGTTQSKHTHSNADWDFMAPEKMIHMKTFSPAELFLEIRPDVRFVIDLRTHYEFIAQPK